MIIKKIAFGNKQESFIEDRLTDGLNIIFSDDNNRGKTLVMQGLMYSLGYESIFPSTFAYKDQYFYSKIDIDGLIFEFLRKGNSFVVKTSETIQVFNTAKEFRYYFDRYIFSLPRIIKDNKVKMVDFSLFYELFFIGQDNRSPSGLISKGQFNKADFKSMVFSKAGLMSNLQSDDDIEELKERIKSLKITLKTTRKKISIIRSNPDIAEIVSKTYDSEVVQRHIQIIKKLYESISEIKRSRQREINRKTKLEALISELRSLNMELTEGNIKCGECGSDKIVYSNKDLTFEVSNTKVRENILGSITKSILQKQEIIDEYTDDLNQEQGKLKKELASSPPDFQEMVVYKDHIVEEDNHDDEAFSLSNEIKAVETELDFKKNAVDDNKDAQKNLLVKILDEMMTIYKYIEPNGNLFFDDLFTKKGLTFSGSEEQEYYFSRLIALNNVLDHEFPIIVDSFRDGELSTQKENKMLTVYKELDKQIIITATLKTEEYSAQKYDDQEEINAIDYSSHNDCKIMQDTHSAAFVNLIDSFEGIVF